MPSKIRKFTCLIWIPTGSWPVPCHHLARRSVQNIITCHVIFILIISCLCFWRGQVASGGLDNSCTIHRVDGEGQQIAKLQDHAGYVPVYRLHTFMLFIALRYLSGAAFLDDNKVITSSGDSTCKLWVILYSSLVSSSRQCFDTLWLTICGFSLST